MTNTLLRTGRSGGAEHGARLLLLRRHRRQPAARVRRGPAGARDRRRAADAVDGATCTPIWPRATPSSTTTPTSATRTRADHTLLVPVFVEGEHLFTVCAKAHQADCGNSAPTTYMPFARDVYEEGGLIFPCVRVQRDYRDVDDVIRMCRRADPRARPVVRRLPGGARRGADRRAPAQGAGRQVRRSRRCASSSTSGSTTPSGGWTSAIRELPGGPPRGIGHPRPAARRPTEGPGQGRDRDRSGAGEDRGRPARQRRLPSAFGLNLSESCAMAGAMIGVFNCLAGRRAAQRGQLSLRRRAPAGGIDDRRSDLPATRLRWRPRTFSTG